MLLKYKVLPKRTLSKGITVNWAIGNSMMVWVRLVETAHCPAVGVKVYVVVAWLFKVGLQVPVMLFSDVVGRTLKVAP